MQQSYFFYNTPIGPITIANDGEALTDLIFGSRQLQGNFKATALGNKAANQIQEYLAGKRHYFDLPLAPSGSEFQKAVWEETADIPYGATKTYAEIAQAIGRPRAARAVGHALNQNPLVIVIPCHRVIGSNGKLVGFAGGLDVKQYLLDLERKHC